ncbi:hypothetical protein HYY72_01180 [Candidatus Woesearchaeota archaeon]|nr:hypothetical protein [Candidatus Woesearchaeota archaeon]
MEPGVCHKCSGAKVLVIGVIVLVNWYLKLVDWALLIGALMVLGGLLKLVKPHCPCGVSCSVCAPAPSSGKSGGRKK